MIFIDATLNSSTQLDTKIMSLAPINPILAPNSNKRFSVKLETSSITGLHPYFKESMIFSHMVERGRYGCIAIAINLLIIFPETVHFC